MLQHKNLLDRNQLPIVTPLGFLLPPFEMKWHFLKKKD